MTDLSEIRALTFDVFGTVVDWRSGIIRDGEALGRAKGLAVDWARFADAWRALYQPALSQVRDGTRPWTKLDDLHRESLERLLVEFGIAGLSEAEIDDLNRAWHRLDPWPDAVAGMTRLRRRYILATLSNGNVALLVNMAKRAGLPWDAVLGAEAARRYKPQNEAYLATAAFLGLRPAQCLMVARRIRRPPEGRPPRRARTRSRRRGFRRAGRSARLRLTAPMRRPLRFVRRAGGRRARPSGARSRPIPASPASCRRAD